MSRTSFFRSGPRHVRDPRQVFNRHNSKLTPAEVAETMGPLHTAFAHICEGVATQDEFIVLRSALQVAQEIEAQGVVRGLHEHIAAALQACQAYEIRSTADQTWKPCPLDFHEIDAMREMLHLHEYQLQQLTAREVQEAGRRLIARTQSLGGQVYQAENDLSQLTPFTQQQKRKRA